MDPPADPGPPKDTSKESVIYPIVDRWGSHPGRSISLERVGQIFRVAEQGFPVEQCDLFEDVVEADGHLRSQADARLDAVSGKDWNVQAGGDKAIDHTAAAEFQDALLLCGNFDEAIEHQLKGLLYGYSASHIRWKRLDGTWVPIWFDNLPHRRIIFDVSGYPRVLTWDNPAYGEPLQAGAWMFNRSRHRVTAMGGLLRTATIWAVMKRMGIVPWIGFLRRYGLPYPYGVYPDGMPKEEKAALKAAVASLGENGYAIFNDKCKIEVVKTEGGGASSPQAALAGFCNQEISKLLTGATLTSGEGSSTGSYALGRVHEDKMFTLTLADARRMEKQVKQQLGALFCLYNGIKAASPGIKIHVVRDQDPQARMDVISRGANELGLDVDEDQVRLEFQLKKPTGKALKGTKVATQIEPPTKTPTQTVE